LNCAGERLSSAAAPAKSANAAAPSRSVGRPSRRVVENKHSKQARGVAHDLLQKHLLAG